MPWAVTFTNPLAQENVGTPLGVPLHPTQLYEAGAEADHPGAAARLRAQGTAVPGAHVLGLHARVRPVPLRHRVLPWRPARHGAAQPLDVAVHLAADRAAERRDAVLAVASRPRTPSPSPVAVRPRHARQRRKSADMHEFDEDEDDFEPDDATGRGRRSSGRHRRRSRSARTRPTSAPTRRSPRCSPGLSRSQVQRLIKEGQVRVGPRPTPPANRRVARPDQGQRGAGRRHRAHASTCRNRSPPKPLPEDIPLDILFEDEQLIVVNKAAGHGRASRGGTRDGHARQRPAAPRAGPQRRRRRRCARASSTGSTRARRA